MSDQFSVNLIRISVDALLASPSRIYYAAHVEILNTSFKTFFDFYGISGFNNQNRKIVKGSKYMISAKMNRGFARFRTFESDSVSDCSNTE